MLREFIGPFILAVLVMNFIFTLGYLVQTAHLIINKGVDIINVSKLFLYRIPALLIYTIPVSALLAVLLSVGRLAADNEIITLRASGIRLFRLLVPVLTAGLLLSVCMVVINDRLIPRAHFASRKILVDIGMKNPTAALEPGVFITSFDRYILFIYGIEKNKLHDIRIYEPQGDDRPARLIVARKGEFIVDPEKNAVRLKLIEGTADEPDPENPKNFYKVNFKTYFMTLNLSEMGSKGTIKKKPKDMSFKELEQQIRMLDDQGVEAAPLVAEINEKLSLAFSPLVFILLGFPLAAMAGRREKSINFGIGFVAVVVYYMLLLGSKALSLQGYLEPSLAMWIPNALFGLSGAALSVKICAY